jgi:hypothetical protein
MIGAEGPVHSCRLSREDGLLGRVPVPNFTTFSFTTRELIARLRQRNLTLSDDLKADVTLPSGIHVGELRGRESSIEPIAHLITETTNG